MRNIFICALFCFSLGMLLNSCKKNEHQLKEGVWRATLKTQSGAEIPFNFTVSDTNGKKSVYILNGKDKFRVDEVEVKDDSVFIQLPLFDSEIRASLGNTLNGKWIKHLATRNSEMDFSAEHDVSWRFFKTNTKPEYRVAGRWSATFIGNEGKDTTVAVAEFQQDGANVTGTFLTTTGDYRFLEGTISDGKLFLSTFDGGNAYLFTADIENENTIVNGKFYAGYSSIKDWTAHKDDKAILPDAYSLTTLKPGYKTINFTFPDMEGKKVSLSDPKFKDKVVIVQFLGSWCPNCMDETAYLAPLYKKYKNKDLEIVGLAYERTADFNRSKKTLSRLKDRFDVDYDFLITGYTNNSEEVLKSIPALNDFKAFPTTIVIDRKGVVQKIHTGFSGPGTGEHYKQFTEEFEKLIDSLLAEK
ncbi:peroxiredoxin family protein [Rubrolithibacter danxiaensis]|uniref:peroxiredoxin family protein n=1 Tax=Rubrolithibacter danxiaensis TaxID=3390805 RepID=UPI003BF7A25B